MSTMIANLALSNLGKANIADIDDIADRSPERVACKQYYEHVRNLLLQVYPWRAAGKTAALAEIVNDRAGKWGYAYQRPNDCLKVRWIRPQYSTDDPNPQTIQQEILNPYDLEGDKLYCNLSPAFLRYTFKLTDTTRFPSLFTEALGWALAARLAMPITRDLKVRNEAMQMARAAQLQAEVADANEFRETTDIDSAFVEARD